MAYNFDFVNERILNEELSKGYGNFKKVRIAKMIPRKPGTAYINVVCIVDDVCEVTVSLNNYSKDKGLHYSIKSIQIISESKIESFSFGKRVEAFAEKYHIHWNIARLIGYIEDDRDALEALERIKNVKNSICSEDKEKLRNKINKSERECRKEVIYECLGDDTYKLLRVKNADQKMIQNLLDYLLG